VPDVAELARLAQGRPLHVEQVLRFCHEGGELAHAPEGLADLVTARADHLPAHARIVLQAVAAAGEEVLRPVLARVADARAIEADELATALAQLEAQRMLVVDGELVAFSHRLLRDVVWDATPADVRRALHAAYAKVLLERGGETPGVLGHHLDLAGDAVRAVPLLGAAGDEAVRGFDDHGAAVMYRRALEAARRALAVDDDDARLADYLGASVKLADALRALGELAPARGVIDEGLARCDGAHRAHEAQLLRAQAHVTQAQGALDKAMATLRQAVGVAMATGNLELVAALYLDLATLHARRGDKAEARRELEEGIDVVTLGEGLPASGGPRVLWRMGARLAELLHGQGQRREAITAGLHALRHADRVEAALGRARVNSLLGFFHEQSGDLVAATRYRQAATDELRRLGDRRSTHELLASRQHTGQFRIDLDDLDLTRLDGDVGDDASEAVRR
jgi:tetratricopeptide (TPR) repeat protein